MQKVLEKVQHTKSLKSSSTKTKIVYQKSQPTKERSEISNYDTERYKNTVLTIPSVVYDVSMETAELGDGDRWIRNVFLPPCLCDKVFDSARPVVSLVLQCCIIHPTHRAIVLFNTDDVKFFLKLVWLIGTNSALVDMDY